MKSRPQSAKSQFEINFQTSQVFFRNKRIFSNEKNQSRDREYSALRRKPIQSEDNYLSDKINASFMNTTVACTERTHNKIFKNQASSRQSMRSQSPSYFFKPPKTEEIANKQKEQQKKVRSFSMEKMTSRQYHHNLKNKIVPDQRLFNNFQQFKPSTPLYCTYQTMIFKKQQTKQASNLEYNAEKLYQDYYYKKTTNHCKVDYKGQKNLKSQRYFFIPKREENLPSTDMNPEKVDNGLKVATQFKDSNIKSSNIQQFYRNSGRQIPPQMDMRYMNELTNHWRDDSGKIKRKKLDFQRRKMKQDMQNERMRKIKYSKQAKIQRNQVCDEKFFLHIKH